MITPEEGNLEDVVYFTTKTDGKVTSMSGLIGIPRLTNDGLHFNCLINPKLSIYGVCYIDNSIISISQTEAIPSSVQIGATLATNGMYRIVKMTTIFSNNDPDILKINYDAIKRNCEGRQPNEGRQPRRQDRNNRHNNQQRNKNRQQPKDGNGAQPKQQAPQAQPKPQAPQAQPKPQAPQQ